jgi:hypothetical protein
VRLFLLLVVLAGCDKLFKLRHLDDVDASTDGARSDGRDIPDARPDVLGQTHSNCPTGFGVQYENSTYRYMSTQVTWYQALTFCQNLDDPTSTKRVHLVVLTGDLERRHVYVDVVFSASRFWTGLSDTKVEGAFQWVTAEPVIYPDASGSAWGASEPSSDPADDCVLSRSSTTDLDALACTTLSQFVCECDDHPYDPTRYTLM